MFKRILMNAADTSPGNGAPAPTPTATPSETPPQAQGAPQFVPVEEFQKLASTIGELAKSVNSLHAADRRAREGKAPAPKQDGKEGTTPTADDTSSLLALRDAFDDATAELKLSKGQKQLLREHVMTKRVSPGDVDGTVADYVSRAGWGATQIPAAPIAATPAALVAATPQRPAGPPVSDRGSPPVSAVPLEEQDVLSMSPSDRDALRKIKGDKWFTDRVLEQSKGIRFRLR